MVVFKTNEKGHLSQACTQILQILQDSFIYNAVCAILNDFEMISFYTWYPYTSEGGCDREVKAKYLGSCNTKLKDPYKDKVPKDMNGCLVSLGWYGLSGEDDVFHFKVLETFGKLRNSSLG